MTTIVCGDDHAVFLEALVPVLEDRGMRVVGTGASLGEVVARVRDTEPDVCLLDRSFGGDRTEGVEPVLRASPRTKVIMLTADPSHDAVLAALRAGAAGYVHKTRGLEHLLGTIKRVVRGEVLVELPAPRRAPGVPRDVTLRARQLTVRERQCLALLVDGHATVAMAELLGVSVATVRTHVRALLTKLGAHSRLEAAALAVRHGLVEPAASEAAAL
ncbi:response regulator transcription factor [Amycolatopsis sacchari]|uniref:DNA-binding response regulator, NarL/FixJ family, contains REC and HTH domains n=1 Tax=Amycolatopsis sacchari TaxID=115433 RepID=A0A1I4DA17_9PSEU|nr:response regulator transcription factor [Amycolatopsis sacchari]SFK90332.1 DNA-binding response regulator, NarL/FixJ family, contains REC and HTH domains [Amycolatopsis sacchari]